MMFRPHLLQSAEHAHSLKRLGIPKHRLRALVGEHARPARRLQPLFRHHLVKQREQKCEDAAGKSKISKQRIEEERRGDKDRKPRRVTERDQARSGQELSNSIYVTKTLNMASPRLV